MPVSAFLNVYRFIHTESKMNSEHMRPPIGGTPLVAIHGSNSRHSDTTSQRDV
jgi:hypothetical protein